MSLAEKLPYYHPFAQGFPGIGSQRVPVDSDILSFANASGAIQVVDLVKLENLVAYLKSQSLWDYARFYPMKSAQNAGSGSTVYGLGKLTSNNMTLVNSPTWGSDGVTFDAASSQEGSIPDFLSNGDLAVFWRGSHTATTFAYARQFGSSGNRSFLMRHINRLHQTIRSANGTAFELYQTSLANSLLSDTTRVMELYDLEPPAVFENNTEKTLAEIVANPQERFNSTADVRICSDETTFMTGTAVCAGFIETALTTTQRETITDLINAL